MAKKKVAKKVAPGGPGDDPAPAVRENYGSFYEAWPKVPELRKYTTQQGMPRIGLEGKDLTKAQQLIREYQDG
jgi:hypothetical protein